MIQRYMLRPTKKDYDEFDYFNDFEDTKNWLKHMTIGQDEDEKKRILEIIHELIIRHAKAFTSFFKGAK